MYPALDPTATFTTSPPRYPHRHSSPPPPDRHRHHRQDGTRIKAEFEADDSNIGSFRLSAAGVSVSEVVLGRHRGEKLPIYAYNGNILNFKITFYVT